MMSYQNGFILSVLHNGNPIKEFAENGQRTCTVPFDQEYKIRLKSKNSKRAKVKVFIDGSNICSGDRSFILYPNQTIDIERWVDSNEQGKKLKFTSLEKAKLTGEVNDPTSSDNGMIRVEFYEEFHTLRSLIDGLTYTNGTVTYPGGTPTTVISSGSTATNSSLSGSLSSSVTNCSTTTSCSTGVFAGSTLTSSFSLPTSEDVRIKHAGVTTQGADSSQLFTQGVDFPTSMQPTIITLKLRAPAYVERMSVPVEGKAFGYLVKISSNFVEVWKDDTMFVDSDNALIKISNDELTIKMRHDDGTDTGFEIKTKAYKMSFVG